MGSESNSSSDLFSTGEIDNMYNEGRNEWRLQKERNVRAMNDRMNDLYAEKTYG